MFLETDGSPQVARPQNVFMAAKDGDAGGSLCQQARALNSDEKLACIKKALVLAGHC